MLLCLLLKAGLNYGDTMLPGMNQKQMKQMMRQFGINPVEIPATEVIIKTPDKDFVIENPQVSKINMMGQETWQVMGKAVERQAQKELIISDEDIDTVMQQVHITREAAIQAIRKHKGDLAAAILELNSE